jgi:hypothetical protein
MGTNYYRIPTASEMELKKQKLITDVTELELSPKNIERNFGELVKDTYEYETPWDRFICETSIHLGKRSGGWKFCWNFHNNQYYSNKEELLAFIRSGRVVDEYGDEIFVEEFINMALNWCQPDGLVANGDYQKKHSSYFYGEKYWDREIDGLRVSSSTEFS